MMRQSERLKHEAEAARAELSHTLGMLRARMTPEQIAREAANYARETPVGEFGRRLVHDLRESPLPLVVIFAGMLWAIGASMLAQRRIGTRETAGGRIEPIPPEKAPTVTGQKWEVAPLNEAVE
jgi:hypothetical protein